jgi:hypothetical protein
MKNYVNASFYVNYDFFTIIIQLCGLIKFEISDSRLQNYQKRSSKLENTKLKLKKHSVGLIVRYECGVDDQKTLRKQKHISDVPYL